MCAESPDVWHRDGTTLRVGFLIRHSLALGQFTIQSSDMSEPPADPSNTREVSFTQTEYGA